MSAHRILELKLVPRVGLFAHKRYTGWVQNVVRQFGPICRGRRKFAGAVLVREDRDGRTYGVPVVVPTA